ncbi:alpha/beta hydrolase [Streptomyces sp. NPDC058335]|uniref:alpha/beta hydrolase n=1 Tax=Streptomyces sp. NPDC058335 TaxID=3346451 RepID=UPI0036522645
MTAYATHRRREVDRVANLVRECRLDDRADVPDFRRAEQTLAGRIPLPAGVRPSTGELGGAPVLATAARGDTTATVLYVHGGLHVAGSARGHLRLWSTIAGLSGAAGVCVALKRAPEHPFPFALGDAFAAYRGLLSRGTPARRIVVAGDSSGAGVALATLVAARDSGLPLPCAVVLLSPWVDLASQHQCDHVDSVADVSQTGLSRRGHDYRAGADASIPLISPINADLRGLPPVLIQVGSAELLASDAHRLAARAMAAGVSAALEVWPGMMHAFQRFDFLLADAASALVSAADFIKEQLRLAQVGRTGAAQVRSVQSRDIGAPEGT